jgi:hypothetical protein
MNTMNGNTTQNNTTTTLNLPTVSQTPFHPPSLTLPSIGNTNQQTNSIRQHSAGDLSRIPSYNTDSLRGNSKNGDLSLGRTYSNVSSRCESSREDEQLNGIVHHDENDKNGKKRTFFSGFFSGKHAKDKDNFPSSESFTKNGRDTYPHQSNDGLISNTQISPKHGGKNKSNFAPLQIKNSPSNPINDEESSPRGSQHRHSFNSSHDNIFNPMFNGGGLQLQSTPPMLLLPGTNHNPHAPIMLSPTAKLTRKSGRQGMGIGLDMTGSTNDQQHHGNNQPNGENDSEDEEYTIRSSSVYHTKPFGH